MHDATECGVLGGLYEMARYAGVGLRIHLDEMVLQEEARLTCQCFDIDPYKAISEGTLLATARRERAKDIVRALKNEGIPASVVGEVTPEKDGLWLFERGERRPLEHPVVDPFWARFEEYLRKRQPPQTAPR